MAIKMNVKKTMPMEHIRSHIYKDAFSKDLKKRGFKFVGSTIMFAHMQAVGMVNDHLVYCFRHNEKFKIGKGGQVND